MATKVLSHFKQQLAGVELEPSSGGCFEVGLDGQPVYSKLQTGTFPDEDLIIAEIGRRLGK